MKFVLPHPHVKPYGPDSEESLCHGLREGAAVARVGGASNSDSSPSGLADGVEREGRPVHHVPASGRRDAGSTAGIDALSLGGTAAALDHEGVAHATSPPHETEATNFTWRGSSRPGRAYRQTPPGPLHGAWPAAAPPPTSAASLGLPASLQLLRRPSTLPQLHGAGVPHHYRCGGRTTT